MINNKGFTTVEVLVCFVIVSIVMMSLFSTISSFNEKRIQESYRAKVYEFKNEVTNVIQEDFVRKGLQYVKITEEGSPGTADGKTYTVDLILGDGTQKQLVVYQRYTRTNYRASGSYNVDDEFYINYGTYGQLIRYDLPDLGSTPGFYFEDGDGVGHFEVADARGKCHNAANGVETCRISQDFQINNVLIYVTNEADLDATGSHVLNIYIGFYHPNLGTKYAIDIVAPIDYHASVADKSKSFPIGTSSKTSTSQVYYPDPDA